MLFTAALPQEAHPPRDGLLGRDGRRLFPIGFYELPQADADLQRMAAFRGQPGALPGPRRPGPRSRRGDAGVASAALA